MPGVYIMQEPDQPDRQIVGTTTVVDPERPEEVTTRRMVIRQERDAERRYLHVGVDRPQEPGQQQLVRCTRSGQLAACVDCGHRNRRLSEKQHGRMLRLCKTHLED